MFYHEGNRIKVCREVANNQSLRKLFSSGLDSWCFVFLIAASKSLIFSYIQKTGISKEFCDYDSVSRPFKINLNQPNSHKTHVFAATT